MYFNCTLWVVGMGQRAPCKERQTHGRESWARGTSSVTGFSEKLTISQVVSFSRRLSLRGEVLRDVAEEQ